MKRIIICLIFAGGLVGCASPAQVDGMAAKNIDVTKAAANTQTKNSISLNKVTGGDETNPLWLSKVSDADFKLALEISLKEALLLSSSVNDSKYLLEVKLIKLAQPLFGLDLKVTATVEYTLKAKSSGQTVYSRIISTPFTATFSDSAMAIKRMRIANEGAVRNNIQQVIDDLLSINIDEHVVAIK